MREILSVAQITQWSTLKINPDLPCKALVYICWTARWVFDSGFSPDVPKLEPIFVEALLTLLWNSTDD